MRLYQPGRSKAMINVSKYNASGTIHNKGTTATSVDTWLVVAISAAEANAGSTSQRRPDIALGSEASAASVIIDSAAGVAPGSTGKAVRSRRAAKPHRKAKTM